MRIALILGRHWHTRMYLDAFRQAGRPVTQLLRLDPLWAPGETQGLEEVASWAALLALPPALAVLLGRPGEMVEAARTLIERRIPLLVEKPLGTRAGQLAELGRLAQARGAFVAVAQPHLSNEFWQEIPAEPGPLSHFRFRLINGSPQRYLDWGVPWVLDAGQAGGGALRNLGLHGVSAIQQLTGQPGEVHSALLSSALYGPGSEEYASVTLRSASVIGQVEVGYTLGHDAHSEFEMTAHWRDLSVRDDGEALTVHDRRHHTSRRLSCLPLARRYEQLAQSTLAALEGGGPPPHSLAAHAQAMRLIDQAYAQASWVRP